jgi:hypothetical protein
MNKALEVFRRETDNDSEESRAFPADFLIAANLAKNTFH